MWGIGEAIESMVRTFAIVCMVSIPLAIWKAIDIVVWLCRHLSVGVR